MKAKSFLKVAIATVSAIAISHEARAEDTQKQTEFKLPPPTRYLTDEQIERITAQTQKIETHPNEYTPGFLKYFHAEIKTSFGGSSYERQVLDITQTYFGLTIGDKVEDAIKNFSQYAGDRKFVIGLNVKASLAPLIMKESTKDKIHESVLEKVKQGAVAAAAIKVKEGFEAKVHPLVAAGKMTEQQYQATLATNLSKTIESVEKNKALINSLAQPHLAEADRRVDELAKEILLQELTVKFAWSPLEDDSVIIFGSVGKSQVNGNFKQGVRTATTFGGWANIGQSTQGTGNVQIGVQTAVADDIKVTFETWFFHNRLPPRGADPLIFNVASMPADVYEDQKDVTHLDSHLMKLTIERPSSMAPAQDAAYFTSGSFNGDRSFGGGFIVRVLPKISVQVEGSFGRDSLYKGALMEAILYHVNDKLTLYVANENVKDLKSAYHVTSPKTEPGQLGAASVGANYIIGKWSLGHDVTAALNATAGLKCFYQNKGMYDKDTCGVDAGLTGQLQWQ